MVSVKDFKPGQTAYILTRKKSVTSMIQYLRILQSILRRSVAKRGGS